MERFSFSNDFCDYFDFLKVDLENLIYKIEVSIRVVKTSFLGFEHRICVCSILSVPLGVSDSQQKYRSGFFFVVQELRQIHALCLFDPDFRVIFPFSISLRNLLC